MARRAWLARVLTRDTASFFGGWFLILWQMLRVPPAEVNEWFLLVGGALIGVPGLAEILALRGGGSATPSPPSPPAGQASPSSPSGSSSGG